MKKIRRVLAVLLVFVMSMALVTGCGGNSKQTMFSIMKDASSMTHYSYEITVKVDSGMSDVESMTVALKGKTDGESVTMGAKISYSFYTIDIDEFLTVTKDAVYVDVEEIFNAFDSILSSLGVSLADFEEEFGTELKCIRLPLVDGLVNTNGSDAELVDIYVSVLENAFKDVKIDSSKGEFTLTVEDMEALSKIADAFITGLLDNRDAILAELEKNNTLDEDTFKELLNVYMNEIIVAFEKFNDEYELGLTDADIDGLRAEAESAAEEAAKEAELDNVNQLYKDTFADLEDNRQDIVDAIADSADSFGGSFTLTNSLTGKNGSRVYNCELQTVVKDKDTDEDLTINVKSVFTEDKNISVSVPKSYTEFSDIVYAALVYSYESGLLGDAFEDMTGLPDIEIDAGDNVDVSEVEQDFDGIVTINDFWSELSTTIEFDKELVRVNPDRSYVDSGKVCFEAVDDKWSNVLMYYEAGITAEDQYAYEQEYDYVGDAYTNIEFSEITDRELAGGVIIREFDVNYEFGSAPRHDRHFVVETADGAIYGTVNVLSDLTETDVLPYEQFMDAVFVNVY